MRSAYSQSWTLILLQILSASSHASEFEITEKPSIHAVKTVCEAAIKLTPTKYYDLDKGYSIDIDMKEHRADITGDGAEEIITFTYVGSGFQPTIRISSLNNPYIDDPRFPHGVSERHDHSSESNRYSLIKLDNHLFYANFWSGKLDSINAKISKQRKSDSFNFVSIATVCTFRPTPTHTSEILLYCGLPDAAKKNTDQPSRCAFAK
ncbi:hypothetical protein ABRP29_10650 [Pseudomonas sp. WHRI 8822A]|uniref:hypothetical protein n=1 Tax=Pseudomonas sp. WHRI 8822A TaxID=3162568 RepID=UPI0032EC12EA